VQQRIDLSIVFGNRVGRDQPATRVPGQRPRQQLARCAWSARRWVAELNARAGRHDLAAQLAATLGAEQIPFLARDWRHLKGARLRLLVDFNFVIRHAGLAGQPEDGLAAWREFGFESAPIVHHGALHPRNATSCSDAGALVAPEVPTRFLVIGEGDPC
jgi:hypothetical protein